MLDETLIAHFYLFKSHFVPFFTVEAVKLITTAPKADLSIIIFSRFSL
jgi:hypothetical protein